MWNQLLALIALIPAVFSSFPPLALTKYGLVLGQKIDLPTGKKVEIFRGIPYASPPLGDLRFEKPVPPRPWKFLNASTERTGCLIFIGTSQTKTEDCLYMTIVRPEHPRLLSSGYPVLVYFGGGAFITGGSSSYTSARVMEKFVADGVVFVNFNSRLGPLGFYAAEDGSVGTNIGIWDTVQALRFVQEVIRGFYGDPRQVTVLGQSAGAGEASMLGYSKYTHGLYKRVIPWCGTVQSIWAHSPTVHTYSRQFEQRIGCADAVNKKDCFKTKSTQEIFDAGRQDSYQIFDTPQIVYWSPVLDDDLFSGKNFAEAIQKGPNVDELIGVNSNEGLTFAINLQTPNSALYMPVQKANQANYTEADLVASLTYMLYNLHVYPEDTQDEPLNKIIQFYLQQRDQYSHDKDLNVFVQFLSDLNWNLGSIREAKTVAAAGRNVYFYINNYLIPNNPLYNPYVYGSSHCAEYTLLFGNITGLEPPIVSPYKETMENFVNMYLSFIKTGVPKFGTLTPQKVTSNSIPYIHIDNVPTLEVNPWADRYAFFTQLAADYGFDWITYMPTSWS